LNLSLPTRTTLTPAQRRVLTLLRDKQYPDNEIVCDGRECWLGPSRTSWRLVNALLGMTAVSDVSDEGGGCRRFTINETGTHILADESQIQAVATALLKGGAWTWKDGKLVPMGSPIDSTRAPK
jgi:hypothetical protein